MAHLINNYEAHCVYCGKWVLGGRGTLLQGKDNKWYVHHNGVCATPSQQREGNRRMGWNADKDAPPKQFNVVEGETIVFTGDVRQCKAYISSHPTAKFSFPSIS